MKKTTIINYWNDTGVVLGVEGINNVIEADYEEDTREKSILTFRSWFHQVFVPLSMIF